jgi:Ca-activated chloride channel family protein
MSEAFRLRWKLDQPFLLAGRSEEIHALVSIEPNTGVFAPSGGALPVHLFALVDVSGSMDFLMRHDPGATTIGQHLTEGQKAISVVSNVPSRREVAMDVLRRLIGSLGPDDRLTLIAFDSRPFVLGTALSASQRPELEAALAQLAQVGGGGTVAGSALEMVRTQLIAQPDLGRACKILLLTDGQDDQPERVQAEVRALADGPGVPLAAFGMGECKVAFLAELARSTLAGSFHHVRDENDAQQLFQQAVHSQKNVVATGAVLKLWLSPDMHVRDLYRTRPEILYVGDLLPDASNVVELALEQMERGKAYEFLFRCVVPQRPAGQRFRLAKATLVYDLPGLARTAETVEANIVVEYTDSEEQARQRSGDVRRVLARAEVQRQVLFLQTKIDLLNQGKAAAQDRSVVAKLLDALVRKLDELGDTAAANQFRAIQAEFLHSGTISQEMLNRSLAASSRAEDVMVAQDIDF